MFNGLLLKESLEDIHILDLLDITKTESWQVGNATADQPKTWTALSFQADESQAEAISEKLSQVLKPRGWYINASTTDHVYVIFPRKVFKYHKGDGAQRARARLHGRSIGIPENQLDWEE